MLELMGKQTRRKYILSQTNFYDYGNKASKLLARALQAKKATTTIHSLSDTSGRKVNSTPDIAKQFVNYYTKSYNLPSSGIKNDRLGRKQMITDFLNKYSPTPISESSQNLDKPLTKEEANLALKQMKTGKSPGPDGLTIGCYKTYADTLTPIFISTFDSCASPITPPRDLLRAHIAVIPNPGKDSSLVTNYRPISLLNVDL